MMESSHILKYREVIIILCIYLLGKRLELTA